MRFIVTIICVLNFVHLQAQDSLQHDSRLSLTGYVKQLGVFNWDGSFNRFNSMYLLHNRLDFKWKPAKQISLVAESRNRLFWGGSVNDNPNFLSSLKQEDVWVDAEYIRQQKKDRILHLSVDRLYAIVQGRRRSLRIGRQRINWGMATVWNPNDIFNSYNLLDIDYEERPGVDALQLVQHFSNLSALDLVYSRNHAGEEKYGIRYFFNKNQFDLQLIAGKYQQQWTIGGGWAGHIGKWGFKGELQHFFKSKSKLSQYNISTEFNRLFRGGNMISFGGLYNYQGIAEPLLRFEDFKWQFNPLNLMPGKYNLMALYQKEISPIINAGMYFIYAPGIELWLFVPQCSLNLSDAWDLDCFGQWFFLKTDNVLRARSELVNLRLKWSF